MNHKEAIESGLFGIQESNTDKWPAICRFLSGIGVKLGEEVNSKGSKYLNIFFVNDDNRLDRASSNYSFKDGFKILFFEEFLSKESFELTSKKIVLNNQYEAVIYKDKVVVGCQTIPIEKVKEILKISEELS